MKTTLTSLPRLLPVFAPALCRAGHVPTNRCAPYVLAFESDAWTFAPLPCAGAGKFSGEIKPRSAAKTVELPTTHTHPAKNPPLSLSSPLLRVETK